MENTTDNQEKLFRNWLEQYKGLIFKVVRVYATSPADQDDLFQDILLQLWISAPRYRGQAKESTWIYRVALNTALVWNRGEKRKRQRHRRMVLEYSHNGPEHQPGDGSRADSGVLEHLNAAIKQLPKADSSILLLHLDGLSYEQMAEVLGITPTHVGVRLIRAKKKLAELMKGVVDEF